MAADTTGNRRTVALWPWVTFALAALLAGGAAWMYSSSRPQASHFEERQAEVRQYFDEHVYLPLDRDLESLLEGAQFERRRLYFEEWEDTGLSHISELRMRGEESRLQALVAEAVEARMRLPAGRYGVASTADPPAHWLLHAAADRTGVALGLTLIVLLAAGVALENAWGHVTFAAFCAASTVGLALFRVASAPAVELPWSGSSGLAAALLGGYLALTTRGVARYYGGLLSGWLLLPLWLASQYALVQHFWQPGFDRSLVLVHALGAAAGFAVATLWVALGLERRADGSSQPKRSAAAIALGKAHRAKNNGQPSHALSLLRTEAQRAPGNPETVSALWKLAQELGREEIAAPAMVDLAERALREHRTQDATKTWMDLSMAGVTPKAEPVTLVCMGEALLDEGYPSEALAAMRRATEGEVVSVLALRIVKVARDLDPDLTRLSAKLALADPRLAAEERESLTALACAAESAIGAAPQESSPASPAEQVEPGQASGARPAAASAQTAVAEVPIPAVAAAAIGMPREEDLAAIEALDPDALSEDTLTDFPPPAGECASPDADEIAGWNDPGFVEGLSAEADDGPDLEDDSTDTLALDLLPGEVADASVPAHDDDAAHESEDTSDTAVQFEGAPCRLKIVNAIPVALEEAGLALDMDGQGKSSLPYRRIEAVAVAAVEGMSARAVIVVDLVLNWRSYGGDEMRVIRIRCDAFDPRRVVPGASPLESLRSLLASLLQQTDATPLPDPRAARGTPLARFASLAAYEAEVLGAASTEP